MVHQAQIRLWIGTILAVTALRGQAEDQTYFRVVSTQTTEIVSLSMPEQALTWTNAAVSNSCTVEVCHDLFGTWSPVTYPIATNTLMTWPVPTNRTYRLGFTPFPYDIGTNAAETEMITSNVYGVISRDGDIICHHLDNGIPWPEALSNQPYHVNLQWEINDRVARTPVGHQTYLAITPIDGQRSGMAAYRGADGDMPLPAPWDTYSFDHPNVKTAFVNHCERMIDAFQPDYLVIGIEVNLLMANAPSNWNAYVALHEYAYTAITNAHSNLSVSVSLTGMDLIAGYTSVNPTNQQTAFQDIIPYSDIYGVSLHAFLSALGADTVPPRDLIRQIVTLTNKPIAICETSYPAETFSILGGSMVFNGSYTKQRLFFENLFSVLDDHDSRFVINFITVDYDGLWDWMGQPDDILKIWRDTGLYDETLIPRPALRTWKGKQVLPLVQGN